MGQEISQPLRCNSTNDNYRASSLSGKSNTSSVKSSSTTSLLSTNTTLSAGTTISNSTTSRPPSATSRTSTSSSYKSLDRQSKYLSEHLYIKSYLDLEEEDRNAKRNFRPAPPGGIRNYKPKILTEKQKQSKKEVDVWI